MRAINTIPEKEYNMQTENTVKHNEMMSIEDASNLQKIAPIRIWCLIRQHRVYYQTCGDSTYIDKQDFVDWCQNHEDIIREWQVAFDK